LTIKFTRHTAGFAAAFSYQQNLHAPANFMGLILLIARLRFSSVDLCAFCGCCFLTTEYTEEHRGICAAYTSRFLSGTHKNYSLVDCPIYSVVKYRPREIAVGRLAFGR